MSACDDGHCITCSDEGVAMTVVGLTQCGAQCRDPDGIDQRVEIDLVEPVEIGDVLLVHGGVALVKLAPDLAPAAVAPAAVAPAAAHAESEAAS